MIERLRVSRLSRIGGVKVSRVQSFWGLGWLARVVKSTGLRVWQAHPIISGKLFVLSILVVYLENKISVR